jgi:hypothetical protein
MLTAAAACLVLSACTRSGTVCVRNAASSTYAGRVQLGRVAQVGYPPSDLRRAFAVAPGQELRFALNEGDWEPVHSWHGGEALVAVAHDDGVWELLVVGPGAWPLTITIVSSGEWRLDAPPSRVRFRTRGTQTDILRWLGPEQRPSG